VCLRARAVGRQLPSLSLSRRKGAPSSHHLSRARTRSITQDLYVAVIKATIEEETVPKEKHVRS
jgi:hypothetical protein